MSFSPLNKDGAWRWSTVLNWKIGQLPTELSKQLVRKETKQRKTERKRMRKKKNKRKKEERKTEKERVEE